MCRKGRFPGGGGGAFKQICCLHVAPSLGRFTIVFMKIDLDGKLASLSTADIEWFRPTKSEPWTINDIPENFRCFD